MKLTNWIPLQCPSLTLEQIFNPNTGAVKLIDDGKGNVTIAYWNSNVLGILEPTADQLKTIAAIPEAQPISVLTAYAQGAYENSLVQAVEVDVGVPVLVDAQPSTQSALNSLALWGTLNPTGTRTWVDNNEVSTVLTGAQFVALATAVFNRVENAFQYRTQAIANINSGSITLISQMSNLQFPTS